MEELEIVHLAKNRTEADVANGKAYHAMGLDCISKGDYQNALKCFELGASLYHEPSMSKAIRMYNNLPEVNEKKGFELCKKLAYMGNSRAQHVVGRMYCYGTGTDRNSKDALIWLNRACDNGHVKAAMTIGEMYRNGTGVEINYKKAYHWYRIYERKYHDDESQYQIGMLYKIGHGDFTRNDNKALKWFTKSAQKNNSDAQYLVGLAYKKGYQDYEKAFEWFKKSAENGYYKGEFELGRMYMEGLHVEKSYHTALDYFEKTLKHGFTIAKQYIERVNLLIATSTGSSTSDEENGNNVTNEDHLELKQEVEVVQCRKMITNNAKNVEELQPLDAEKRLISLEEELGKMKKKYEKMEQDNKAKDDKINLLMDTLVNVTQQNNSNTTANSKKRRSTTISRRYGPTLSKRTKYVNLIKVYHNNSAQSTSGEQKDTPLV